MTSNINNIAQRLFRNKQNKEFKHITIEDIRNLIFKRNIKEWNKSIISSFVKELKIFLKSKKCFYEKCSRSSTTTITTISISSKHTVSIFPKHTTLNFLKIHNLNFLKHTTSPQNTQPQFPQNSQTSKHTIPLLSNSIQEKVKSKQIQTTFLPFVQMTKYRVISFLMILK